MHVCLYFTVQSSVLQPLLVDTQSSYGREQLVMVHWLLMQNDVSLVDGPRDSNVLRNGSLGHPFAITISTWQAAQAIQKILFSIRYA